VTPDELWFDSPFTLYDSDGRYTIGWQRWTEKKGGPGFVTLRRNAFGTLKIVQRYPLTDKGWVEAWQELQTLDPDTAEKVRAVLNQRTIRDRAAFEMSQLDASSLGYLLEVTFLGGYLARTELAVGACYDLRFLEDRLSIFPVRGIDSVRDLPYSELQAVEVGGPGLVRRWSPAKQALVTAAFGVTGALIAYGSTKIQTVVRVQAPDSELFFLHTRSQPDDLRIQLSRALGVVRQVQAAGGEQVQHLGSPGPVSVADELSRLAEMVDRGILTRAEFDHLKTKLIAEQ
jgi:hypothetical protein